MNIEPEKFLLSLMQKALAAVKPERLVQPHIVDLKGQALTVVGMGKAAAHMALGIEKTLGSAAQGIVVVPYGYEANCQWIKVRSAAHPLPDQNGIDATNEIIEMLKSSNNPVLALISGGGSSVCCGPASFISLSEKQSIISQLLAKGTSIGRLNQVRAVLSSVKGGSLARFVAKQPIQALVLSDVPGNDPNLVASGPFAPNRPDAKGCLAILDRAGIKISKHIRKGILSVSIQNNIHPQVDTRLIGSGATALQAAEGWAKAQGLRVLNLGDALEGNAEALARVHLQRVTLLNGQSPILLLSGGEANVEVSGAGQGGPNRHFLAHLARSAPNKMQIAALAIDTDGCDGSDGEAGAWFASEKTRNRSQDLARAVSACDSGGFFKKLGTSIHTGPTGTNVNDFRAILLLK
ncbi:MAG: hypothetical protein COA47_07685 [Robiginitomaculum sp.]|nr:MAG: hypothetical protein COA47_07685 [Robiginitomaculum sp.]